VSYWIERGLQIFSGIYGGVTTAEVTK
jgi:hypothetical protein